MTISIRPTSPIVDPVLSAPSAPVEPAPAVAPPAPESALLGNYKRAPADFVKGDGVFVAHTGVDALAVTALCLVTLAAVLWWAVLLRRWIRSTRSDGRAGRG